MLFHSISFEQNCLIFADFDEFRRLPHRHIGYPGSNNKVIHTLYPTVRPCSVSIKGSRLIELAVVFSCFAGNSRLSLVLLINFVNRLVIEFSQEKTYDCS